MTNENIKPEYEKMLNKLNELYDQQDILRNSIQDKLKEYNQIEEDLELLQVIFMHKYNKDGRNVRR